jgi:hypothetical protein
MEPQWLNFNSTGQVFCQPQDQARSAWDNLPPGNLPPCSNDEKAVQKAEVRTEPEDVKKQWILEKVYDAVGHELCPDIQKQEDWEMRFDSRGKSLSLQYCSRARGGDENNERRIMHWAYPSSDEEEGLEFYQSKVKEPNKRQKLEVSPEG